MPSIVVTLDGIDLSQLSVRLESAQNVVQGDLFQAVQNLDPRELLGELGETLKSGGGLPADPSAAVALLGDAFAELQQIIAWPDFPIIGDVVEEIQRLIDILEEQIERFGLDGEGSIVDRLMAGADGGNLTAILGELTELIVSAFQVDIPDIARGPLAALQGLARGTPQNADELASLLSGFYTGLDYAALCAPCDRLAAFLAQIAATGGDLAQIEATYGQIAAQVRQVNIVLNQPEVNVAQALNEIGQINAALDLLFYNHLPGALSRLTTELAALNVEPFLAEMRAALTPLVFNGPRVSFDLDNDLMAGFRALDAFASLDDAAALEAAFDERAAEFAAIVAASGIEELPRAINLIFDEIIEQMQRVPMRTLREDLVDELNSIEARVRNFEGFQAPRQFGEQIRTIESQVAAIDTTAIQNQVTEFGVTLQQALDGFSIAEIRDEVQGVVTQVGDALAQFVPAIDTLGEELRALTASIDEIDLRVAGDASIDLIAGIRTQVGELAGSDDLPEAAKIAIAGAATVLEKLDVTVEVRAPFQSAIAVIDVEPLLAPLEDVLTKVRAVLTQVTPAALVEQLEEPFEALLAQLERLKPAALVAGLSAQFQQLIDAVRVVDPRQLVAPLEQEFERLLTLLRDAVDPTRIFSPLKQLYARLQEVLDLLKFEKVLGGILNVTADLPAKLGQSVQGALENQTAAGVTLPATDAGDEPQPFHLGDLLRPLAALIDQVRLAVSRLADELLGEALALLAVPLNGLRRLTQSGTDLLDQAANAVTQRMTLLDPFVAGPAQELRAALQDLALAVNGANLSAEDRAQIGDSAASLSLDLRTDALTQSLAGAEQQIAQLQTSLLDVDLNRLLKRLSDQIDTLAPPPVFDFDATDSVNAQIDALFAAVNLRPLIQELDELGARVQAKIEQFATTLANGLIKVWDTFARGLAPITPGGMLQLLDEGMARVRSEFDVLDPAIIEAEVAEVLDAVIDGLRAFSPAQLAAELGFIFDAALAKLNDLDPATLLADLNPLESVIEQFGSLRPSVMLQPLVESTADLTAAFEALVSTDLLSPVLEAVARLKAQLEEILAVVEAELRGLIDDLQGMAGGISVSASLSIG